MTDISEISQRDRDGSHLRTVICRNCGLVYSDPRPDTEDVRKYYEHDYRIDYKSSWQPKPKHIYRAGKVAVSRAEKLAPTIPLGCSIFDVGAGNGALVYVLRKMGCDASGIEPNLGYATFASNALGVPVTHGFCQDIQIESESQDLVTMFHVLEHIEHPCGALLHVRDWLREDGHLFVEVPNVEATCQWPHSRFHRAHLYNFNPATLEAVGRKAGYEIEASSLSSDGGNIEVLFRKSAGPPATFTGIPGNCDRVFKVLRRHTVIRHALSKYPYLRPVHKVTEGLAEMRATREHEAETILNILAARLVPVSGETG